MGLLHLMRIKFRNPIPDIFASKRCSDNDQGGQVMGKSYCMFSAFKSYLSPLIWQMQYKTVFLFMLHIVYGFHNIQVRCLCIVNDTWKFLIRLTWVGMPTWRLLFGYQLRSQEVGGGSLWVAWMLHLGTWLNVRAHVNWREMLV